MKNQRCIFAYSLILLIFLQISSCKHEDLTIRKESENYSNLVDYSKNNYNLTLFHAALQQVGLTDLLRSEGPFTIFAPSNQAFNELGITNISDFSKMNKDSLKRMLNYHIIERRLTFSEVPANTIDNKYENLAKLNLFIGKKEIKPCTTCALSKNYYVNGASISNLEMDIPLANGVLNIIDKVLKYQPTVQDILIGNKDYSYFIQLLKQMGDWDRLAQPQPITIFAPINDAFIKQGITLEEIKTWDQSNYYKRFWRVYQVHNHFFLSDMEIFGPLSGSGYYQGAYYRGPIPGDEDYVFGIASDPDRTPFYASFYHSNIRSYFARSKFLPKQYQDYKADNGIVHTLSELLILPKDATINKN